MLCEIDTIHEWLRILYFKSLICNQHDVETMIGTTKPLLKEYLDFGTLTLISVTTKLTKRKRMGEKKNTPTCKRRRPGNKLLMPSVRSWTLELFERNSTCNLYMYMYIVASAPVLPRNKLHL